MKILHVENSSGRGGSLKSLQTLWPAPPGCEVHVLSLQRKWAQEISLEVPVSYLPKQSIYQAWKLLQNLKIDIVHINNSPVESWSLVLAAWWEGLPVVSHLRSVRSFRKLEKLLKPFVDEFFVLSQTHRKLFSRNDPVEVIYNGIDDPGKFPWPDFPVIGIFSVLKKGKGQEDILKALASIQSPWKLLIVGGEVTDQESTRTQLEAIAKDLKIDQKVSFLGHVDNPIEMMKNCFLIVDPSHKEEGFRRTLGEAALLGRRVLASNVGGAADLLESDQLIPSGDILQWKDSLSRELNAFPGSKNKITKLQKKAQKLFDKNFSRKLFWNHVFQLRKY